MDVFVFHPAYDLGAYYPLQLVRGELVNGIKSKTWIERYRTAGEFTFVADVSSGIADLLSVGSYISHINTQQVMIVENQEFVDNKGKDSEVTITGRSYETILDQRVVGGNKYLPVSTGPVEYSLAAEETWLQVQELIEDHILVSRHVPGGFEPIPYIEVETSVVGTGLSEARVVAKGSLYDRVLELLGPDDLGLKFLRPELAVDYTDTTSKIVIHNGIDRSNDVILSYANGEIESLDRLVSNKKDKDWAYVTGRWIEDKVSRADVFVPEIMGQNVLHVDASDIDSVFEAAPTGGDLTAALTAMRRRARDELFLHNAVNLAKVEVSPNADYITYRESFDIGDFVSVVDRDNARSIMRVVEYVELEDENGQTGYPTLGS